METASRIVICIAWTVTILASLAAAVHLLAAQTGAESAPQLGAAAAEAVAMAVIPYIIARALTAGWQVSLADTILNRLPPPAPPKPSPVRNRPPEPSPVPSRPSDSPLPANPYAPGR